MQILEQLKQPFRIDASNQGDKYQRNHIRHHLIPYLQTHYNPAIINRLTEMAKVIQQEHAYLVQLTEKWMLQAVYQEDGRVILNCNVASNLHPTIQVRMCREMYRMVTGHTQNLSYNHSLEMQKMIEAPHGKRVSLPGNVCCEKIYSKLHVYLELQKDKAPSFFCQVKLNAETCLPDGSRLFTKIISLDQVTFPLQDNTLVLDLNEVGYDLFVRYRHNGDVFKGLGAKGHKKLKDFFIDQKIPHYKRDHIPLLVNASDQILWIIPYRSSEYGKLTAQSERVLWCYHAGGTNNA